MSLRRGYQEIATNTPLERWLASSSGGKVRDYGEYWHVTIFFKEGGHVSANIDKFSTRTWEVHGTLYEYDSEGKKVDKKTIDF